MTSDDKENLAVNNNERLLLPVLPIILQVYWCAFWSGGLSETQANKLYLNLTVFSKVNWSEREEGTKGFTTGLGSTNYRVQIQIQ